MSLIDTLKKIDLDSALDVAAEALDVIGALAGSANAHNAADIVMAIKHVHQAVTDVADAKITPEEARYEMKKLHEGIASNDAEADKAVDAKFGPEGK